MTSQQIRAERLRAARQLGRHTPAEWRAILARANGRCARCGRAKPLEKDHIVPVYRGGSDAADNLRAVCAFCNRSRGHADHAETLTEEIQDLRERLGEDFTTFARRFRQSPRTVEAWEQGCAFPTDAELLALGRERANYFKRASRALKYATPDTGTSEETV